jgi:nucleoside-diphosphate kinase
MTRARTLLIVKPDAVAAGSMGKILAQLEGEGGFRVVALRLVHLNEDSARRFYAMHEGKPFFEGLIHFMTSGPCLPMVLEREEAIGGLREFIGATDPAQAPPGSIRRLFGTDVQRNAVHASDSPEAAEREIAHFFPEVGAEAGASG